MLFQQSLLSLPPLPHSLPRLPGCLLLLLPHLQQSSSAPLLTLGAEDCSLGREGGREEGREGGKEERAKRGKKGREIRDWRRSEIRVLGDVERGCVVSVHHRYYTSKYSINAYIYMYMYLLSLVIWSSRIHVHCKLTDGCLVQGLLYTIDLIHGIISTSTPRQEPSKLKDWLDTVRDKNLSLVDATVFAMSATAFHSLTSSFGLRRYVTRGFILIPFSRRHTPSRRFPARFENKRTCTSVIYQSDLSTLLGLIKAHHRRTFSLLAG